MTSFPERTWQLDRDETGKMFAPSAERNKDAIVQVLVDLCPDGARVLEIASGTGQHTVHFAAAFPAARFQPSDIDPDRCASIRAYMAESGLPNIDDPIVLDAAAAGWPQTISGFDLIVIVNLFHLISEEKVKSIITQATQALADGGKIVVYGPFMRGGELTSEGDEAFHQALVRQNLEIGYKDDFDVIEWFEENWLELRHVLEMPANNLCLVAQKPNMSY